MTKWFTSAALALVVMTGVAWGYAGWSDAAPCPEPVAAPVHADPLSSSDAGRHFRCQSTHWASMVLVME